ncbi:MAG TPA: hypothetical protein PLH72_17595 [Vicinamibacterales bacterium]|nr:hypothetical protein [Vicinamibacterales bacterium]HRA21452.1 hypothetical protein [Anaerolineae bacterium]
MPAADALDTLQQRVDAIEGGYEFLLAYAAQGLATDEGYANSEQLRTYLRRMDEGIDGLEAAFRAVLAGTDAAASFDDFLGVLARDAAASRAALRVVASRPGVSSQLVDNLNASIHLRALLTDLFLLDEAVKGLK